MNTRDRKWYTVDLQLLRVKGFYFFTFGAIGSLLPYLALYMKDIGLTTRETGVIYGVMPFVAFMVKPAFGLIADKFQRHKLVLVICCILTAVCFNLILLVPISYIEETQVKAGVSCRNHGSYIEDCTGDGETTEHPKCPLSFNRYVKYAMNHTGFSGRENELYHIKKNISVQLANESYQIDDAEMFRFKCIFDCEIIRINRSREICFKNRTTSGAQKHCFNTEPNIELRSDIIFKNDNLSSITNMNRSCIVYQLTMFEYKNHIFRHMTCENNTVMQCNLKCTDGRHCRAYNAKYLRQTSFWLFLILLFLGNVTFSPILSLNDAISYDILGDRKRHTWGKQRLWGTIALAVFAITSALVMDILYDYKASFNISFYLYGILFLIMAIVAMTAEITSEIACTGMLKGIFEILRDFSTIIFLSVVAYFGFLAGSIEAFLFWFLEADLGNSLKIIPGMCLLCNSFSETIVLYFSGKIIKRFGHFKCLYIAFLAYCIRFVSYSFLTQAWYVLPIELLNGITFGLMWATVTSYGSIITPPGMSGTIQGILSGLNFGFGKGIGALVTGELYTEIGSRWTFRLYGGISILFLVVYLVFNNVSTSKRKDKRRIENGVDVNGKNITLLKDIPNDQHEDDRLHKPNVEDQGDQDEL